MSIALNSSPQSKVTVWRSAGPQETKSQKLKKYIICIFIFEERSVVLGNPFEPFNDENSLPVQFVTVQQFNSLAKNVQFIVGISTPLQIATFPESFERVDFVHFLLD
jgi:hypothetical protein